jgi:hypothetical protein
MLVPRQQYSRELKVAAKREIDSGKGIAEVACMYQLSPKRFGNLEKASDERGANGRSLARARAPKPDSMPSGIGELERKIGQQTMEIDFKKKALRRFRDHPQRVVAHGDASCLDKSRKRPKPGQP